MEKKPPCKDGNQFIQIVVNYTEKSESQFTAIGCVMPHRVFCPQIYFTLLVLWLGGQVGHQKKQNSSRNWLFLVLWVTFQPKLNNLKKCPKLSLKMPIWGGFFKLFNFGWKVAHETKGSQFLEEFRFFWYPTWPLSRKTSGDISGFTICFETWHK